MFAWLTWLHVVFYGMRSSCVCHASRPALNSQSITGFLFLGIF